MREERRQACLQALGLTPWVARTRLPGAAESPQLQPPPAPAEQPVPEGPAPESANASEAAPAEARPGREPASAEPAPREADTGAAETPAAGPEGDAQPRTGLAFTLHALATPALMLMVQQSDPDAPEPGRDEQRLVAALLRYFNAGEATGRTLAWPLPGADNEAEQARATLEAFTGRLCSDQRLQRVLWLVDDPLSRILLGEQRFSRFAWYNLDALAVATPAEMLTDPVTHKRASWQAMVRHGFVL